MIKEQKSLCVVTTTYFTSFIFIHQNNHHEKRRSEVVDVVDVRGRFHFFLCFFFTHLGLSKFQRERERERVEIFLNKMSFSTSFMTDSSESDSEWLFMRYERSHISKKICGSTFA